MLIGPFLMKYLSEADIDETLLFELGGTKHQLLNIPVVPSSGLFMPLMNTLFDYPKITAKVEPYSTSASPS